MTTTPPILPCPCPCPYCENEKFNHTHFSCAVSCPECKMLGPLILSSNRTINENSIAAITAWNRIAADRTVKTPKRKIIYAGMPPKFDDLGYNLALSEIKQLK